MKVIIEVITAIGFWVCGVASLVGAFWMLLDSLPGFTIFTDRLKWQSGPHVAIVIFIISKCKYLIVPAVVCGMIYFILATIK